MKKKITNKYNNFTEKDLFHKAVLMGAYLNNPTIPHQESNEDHAREIAKTLGYDGDVENHKELLSFLKKQKTILLIEGCRRCQTNLYNVT